MTFKKTIFFLILLSLYNCGIYTFSGSSIPKEAKNIFISKIVNNADLTSPDFAQEFTNALIDRFMNETNLSVITNSDADLIFKGEIIKYDIKPISINSNENATQNRLTISIKIKYENNILSSNNYEKEFTNYTDYDSSLDFLEIEESLNQLVIEDLIESIFNDTFSNW